MDILDATNRVLVAGNFDNIFATASGLHASNASNALKVTEEAAMDFDSLAPIALFVCISLTIKFVMDAYVRRRIVEAHASEEIVKAMLAADEKARQLSTLRWGLTLTGLGLAFGSISALGLDIQSPAALGLLTGAAGIGLLVHHFITNNKVS
jgi:hypothetical protein